MITNLLRLFGDKRLKRQVRSYTLSVEAIGTFDPEIPEEFESLCFSRHEIHEAIQRLGATRVNKADLEVLKKADESWLKKVSQQKKFSLNNFDRNPATKQYWWFWLDKLDELTDEERGTL